jgi:hypothetical protein
MPILIGSSASIVSEVAAVISAAPTALADALMLAVAGTKLMRASM